MIDMKPKLVHMALCIVIAMICEAKAEFPLDEAIEFLEENSSKSISAWESQSALQRLPLQSELVVERKTTRYSNGLQVSSMKIVGNDGLEFESLIRIVNEDYAAVINRSKSTKSFSLVSLFFPSDEKYATLQKMFSPWRVYLNVGGGAFLIDELRSGEIIDSRDDELEGLPVHVVKVKAIAKEHDTGKPLWEVVRTFTFNRQSPFRLLRVVSEQTNDLVRETRFLDWTEQSGVHFPTKTQEILRETPDGAMVRGHQITYSFTENVGDFDPEQTRLSYYGLTEPASPSSNRLGLWLGLSILAIIGGVVFFVRRRASRFG